jgi:hypothetical protein
LNAPFRVFHDEPIEAGLHQAGDLTVTDGDDRCRANLARHHGRLADDFARTELDDISILILPVTQNPDAAADDEKE